jgi:hypothetical protein
MARSLAKLGGILPSPPNTAVTLWCSGLVVLVWALGGAFGWEGGDVTSAVICAICGFSVVRARIDNGGSSSGKPKPPPTTASILFAASALLSGASLTGGCGAGPDFQWHSVTVDADIRPAEDGEGVETDGTIAALLEAWDAPFELRVQWTETSVGACLGIWGLPAICGKFDRETGLSFGLGLAMRSAEPPDPDSARVKW